MMTDREAFEAWWDYFTSIHDDWMYADSEALRFQAWQAATAATQERCAQAVLDLDKEKWFPSQRDFAEACVDAIRKGGRNDHKNNLSQVSM